MASPSIIAQTNVQLASGVQITQIACSPTNGPVGPGQILSVGGAQVTVAAPGAPGGSSVIPINAFTPGSNIASGSLILDTTAQQVTTVATTSILLNQASAAQVASGNTGDLACGSYTELDVDVNVTAITGGTAPNIAFILERKGADGVYYPIWSPAAVAVAGTLDTTVGRGGTVTQGFGDIVRLRWVLGGTVPPTSVTFSASIKAK